jgi:hypothetical protein
MTMPFPGEHDDDSLPAFRSSSAFSDDDAGEGPQGAAPARIPSARAELKRRIGRAESPNDDARNPRSSAQGRYQFTDDTWLRYYPRVFGDTGESRGQILRRKTDGAVQERLMDALISDNENALGRNGFETDAGNLYLAHFAGSPRAIRILQHPEASAESLFGRDAVRANPFLRGMRGRDVIDWAHRRMGPR